MIPTRLPPTPKTPPSPQTALTLVQDEQQHLDQVLETLAENPAEKGASEEEVASELARMQEEMRRTTRGDDRAALSQQIEMQTALVDQIRRGKSREEVDPDSPYFGHLRSLERGRTVDVCLGKATRLGGGLRIVDWRHAPVSRLFYCYEEGDEYTEDMGGQVREGEILARRTVHISQGELLRVSGGGETWVKHDQTWEPLAAEAAHLAGGQGTALRAGSSGTAKLGAGGRLRRPWWLGSRDPRPSSWPWRWSGAYTTPAPARSRAPACPAPAGSRRSRGG